MLLCEPDLGNAFADPLRRLGIPRASCLLRSEASAGEAAIATAEH